MSDRDELIQQVAASTNADLADTLIEQEAAIAASQVEIKRLDMVIQSVHETVDPVIFGSFT